MLSPLTSQGRRRRAGLSTAFAEQLTAFATFSAMMENEKHGTSRIRRHPSRESFEKRKVSGVGVGLAMRMRTARWFPLPLPVLGAPLPPSWGCLAGPLVQGGDTSVPPATSQARPARQHLIGCRGLLRVALPHLTLVFRGVAPFSPRQRRGDGGAGITRRPGATPAVRPLLLLR